MKTFEFEHPTDEDFTLRNAVFQAIGAASVCWTDLQHTGIFETEQANAIAEALLAEIVKYQYDIEGNVARLPQLGFATTRQLLEELFARFETNPDEDTLSLTYRTVDAE